MVQVLEAVPSFGTGLAQALTQATGSLAQGLMQRSAMSQLQNLLTPQTGAQGTQPGQAPQSPLQSIFSQPNGPNLGQILSVQKITENALGKEGATAAMNYMLNQQKQVGKEAAEIRKEERGLAQSGTEEFFKKVETDRIKLPQEQMSAEMIVDAIKSNEIDPFSQAHIGSIASSLGAPKELMTIFETPGSKEFKTARKTFIGNTIQDAFRGTTSRTEINLAEDMLAELGVSKEGNLASIWGVQSAIDIRRERVRLTDQLKEEGITPSKIPSAVNKMMQPYIKQVKDEYFEALRTLRKK